jgi:hypothetical protein
MTEQQQIEELLSTFSTKGWAVFKEFYEEQLKALKDNAWLECDTADKWQIQRGKIDILTAMLGYDEYVRQVADQLAEKEEDV